MEYSQDKSLQHRIKETRLKRKLTQAQLAKKSYLSKNTISNVERGITKKLKNEDIELLSNALQVTVDYLLGKSNHENENWNRKTQPFYILPEWNWEVEIKQVLKKHSKHKDIENALRDTVYFAGQLDSKFKSKEKVKVEILLEILNILSDDEKYSEEYEFLLEFLKIIKKKSKTSEEVVK